MVGEADVQVRLEDEVNDLAGDFFVLSAGEKN
jgi:hypothetical protein